MLSRKFEDEPRTALKRPEHAVRKYADLPKTDDLKDVKAWANFHPIILQAGRCSHYVPPGMPEEDVAAYTEGLDGTDPSCERFRDIGEHTTFPDPKQEGG